MIFGCSLLKLQHIRIVSRLGFSAALNGVKRPKHLVEVKWSRLLARKVFDFEIADYEVGAGVFGMEPLGFLVTTINNAAGFEDFNGGRHSRLEAAEAVEFFRIGHVTWLREAELHSPRKVYKALPSL